MIKTPKLRFSEFNDEWKEKKVEEIFDFYTTNSYSRDCLNDTKGIVKNIHYGDIHMNFSTILDAKNTHIPYINNEIDLSKISKDCYCKEGDIIIADASEDYDDIGKTIEIKNVENQKIVAGLHTMLARDNKDITVNGYRGYMFLNNNVRKQIKILAVGAKVLGISKSNINKVSINIPSKIEQQRIAQFFSLIDKKIQKQQEKVELLEEYKKGMMQKIFSQEIRFKGDNGEEYPEWEEKKLGDILTIPKKIKEENIRKDKLLTVKLHRMGVQVNKNTDTLDIGSTVYYKRNAGELIYGKQNFFNGAIAIIPKELDGFLSSGDVPSLSANRHKVDLDFLLNFIGRSEFYRKTEALASGTGSKRLHEKILLNIEISLPTVQEQQKIANFLSILDKKLEKEQEKLDFLNQWKKGLLQQMFV
ncbi:TPA: restriction endonuclease subunit S [Clostridium botulinum]|nr:restriction endonuclease subunit S [Clostridium botulinum]